MKFLLITCGWFLIATPSFSDEIKHPSCVIYLQKSLWNASPDDYNEFRPDERNPHALGYLLTEGADDFLSNYKRVLRNCSLDYYDLLENILAEKGFEVQLIEIPIFIKSDCYIEKRHSMVKNNISLLFEPNFTFKLSENSKRRQEIKVETSGKILTGMRSELFSKKQIITKNFEIESFVELEFLQHNVNELMIDALEKLQETIPICKKISVESDADDSNK